MADDADVIPVKDNRSAAKKAKLAAVNNENAGITDEFNRQRQVVHTWSREDVEDKYLRLYEENILLKKHARRQEEKIKRMATKLLRLVNDKKKTDVVEKVKGRDIETEEMMEDLHDKIRDLERQNHNLKDKLMVTKQQLTSTAARSGPYQSVPSRIDTGRPKSATDKPGVSKNVRVTGPRPRSPQLPRYGHSLLEDAKHHNRELEQLLAQQNEQMNIYEQEMENMREQMRVREVEFEEDIIKIKQQTAAGQRATVQENVDMIKMQREVREKTTKLEQLQAKYEAIDKKLKAVKSSHDHLLREMETQSEYLKQEQARVISLQNELKDGSANHRRILELEELIDSLRKEMDILKEANEKLVHSAFDLERERDWRQREKALKVQIAQLEATLKADVGEKGGVLDKLAQERDEREKAEKELSEMRVQFYGMKQELDDTKEKMKYFTQESDVDFTELEEALVLVKQKKQKEDEELDFLERVEDEANRDFKKDLTRVQAEYADTVHELEKTRNMLIVQHNINKDYQNELQAVSNKMSENKTEYETKLDEYARLLDIRAARIKKLEHQLRDVAYGTKQFKVKPEVDVESDAEDIDDTVSLERGENLFEIHITKLSMSPAAVEALQDSEPTTFCTWEFFEFELQSTALLRGQNPKWDFTSQYVVKVDDFFLHYLQRKSATLELHQALGTDYKTVAACQLVFKDIFEKTHGRIHGQVQLMGVNECAGVVFGTLEYWVRLRVPVDQALRLYKERTKALGYISSNVKATEEALLALEQTGERADNSVNELNIKIIRCTGLEARRQGLQPSGYAVYKFFDFPDHDTNIIPNSNQPEFQDRKIWPVTMTPDVDRYLKSQALHVYLFDDTETEESTYLGKADIPLITLAHDKPIKGTYDLRRADGTQNGTIDVQLKWQYPYVPPRGATRTAAQVLASGPLMDAKDAGPSVALMPGEDISPPPLPKPQPSSSSKSLAKKRPSVDQRSPEDNTRKQTPPTHSRTSSHHSRVSQPRTPPRSQPRTPSLKGSPRDEVLVPAAAALAASAPEAARRGSQGSVRSRDEEEIEPVMSSARPVPSRRPQISAESRDEGLEALGASLSWMDDQFSVKSEHSVVEEEGVGQELLPAQHSRPDVIHQLASLAPSDRSKPPSKSSKQSSRAPSEKGSKPPSERGSRPSSEKGSRTASRAPSEQGSKPPSERGSPRDEADGSEDEVTETAENKTENAEDASDEEGTMEMAEDEEQEEEKVDKKKGKFSLRGIFNKDGEKDKKEKKGRKEKKKEKKKGKKGKKSEDEDETAPEESIEEDPPAPPEAPPMSPKSAGESSVESDSEGLVVQGGSSSKKSPTMKSDAVTVTIFSLTFEEGSPVMEDDSIKLLFVEYRFLGCPPAELETPYPLPKPEQPDVPIMFNFSKVFHVDMEQEYERRQYLASMLLPDDSDEGRIRFTVVSEPTDDNASAECEDVGVAFVSVKDILDNQADIIEQAVPVYDVTDESTVLGSLLVTVEALDALRAVSQEMNPGEALDQALSGM